MSNEGGAGIGRAILGTSATSFALGLATFISGVVVARALGVEARGEYGALLLVGQVGSILGLLSFFDAAVVRIASRNDISGPYMNSL